MSFFIIFFLVFMPLQSFAQTSLVSNTMTQGIDTLVRNVQIDGFVLQDKAQFVKLFKPYRNKRLSQKEIDIIQQSLEEIYELAGYQGLVSIDHRFKKNSLIFTVTLIE